MLDLNADTGTLIQVLTGPSYQFNQPDAITDDGTHIWVTNIGDWSVTELNATTGAPIQVLTAPSYQFNDPTACS